ncbi:hypothetical protein ScPMuIL_008242 [Solemya velum]
MNDTLQMTPDTMMKGFHDHITKKPERTDIMLLGYYRGGTTFVGRILGHRTGSFYFYEPLWNLSKWGEFKKTEWCDQRKPYCREPKSVWEKSDTAIETLMNVYRCNFTGMESSVIIEPVHVVHGGPSWEQYGSCDKSRNLTCLKNLSIRCSESHTIVSKVLRLSFELIEELLLRIPTLKVIHMIRDPRPVIMSRFKYFGPAFENKDAAALSLCQKMLFDFNCSQTLRSKYPDRVVILPYETIAKNPQKMMGYIFEKFNLEFTDVDKQEIHNITEADTESAGIWNGVQTNSSDTAIKWIREIRASRVAIINKACSPLFNMLSGYNISYPKSR